MLLRRLMLAVFLAGGLASPALPQTSGFGDLDPPDVLSLKLGSGAGEQPGPFREFACGTDGGPPARPLSSFADFASCPPEADTGLHEVAFRYDDEIEYYALAMNLQPIAERYHGTRFGSFPVIVSALMDDQGILRGYRVVTDDRVSIRERRVAYSMAILARSRLKGEWTCEKLPLADGETPIGRAYTKEDCIGTSAAGHSMILQSRDFHRRGQSAIDPHSGRVREGLYESTARLEVFDAGYEPP